MLARVCQGEVGAFAFGMPFLFRPRRLLVGGIGWCRDPYLDPRVHRRKAACFVVVLQELPVLTNNAIVSPFSTNSASFVFVDNLPMSSLQIGLSIVFSLSLRSRIWYLS